ncbi:hypothetical protein M7I_5069 [Glarea lozoyensis 74030]|uniref:Uncharacterized protein n=1 Tax=Glarea lozoyensis (strain ATCC 74030 / MF5533) TaxID=1104152 RepID=H0EQW0_GLAL7|nr:hypothetical protein M7I_5069 [Glarea lozoyensis 74030]
MSSTTKYQPAPQRDSLDTAMYSQAPPSYADEATASSDQAALLGGGPRSSEDNVPDDFKFGGSVAEATIDIRMAFVRKDGPACCDSCPECNLILERLVQKLDSNQPVDDVGFGMYTPQWFCSSY